MPRLKSENVVQITFKVPIEWLMRCDAIAAYFDAGIFGAPTRTAVMRNAMRVGIEEIERSMPKTSNKAQKKKTVK